MYIIRLNNIDFHRDGNHLFDALNLTVHDTDRWVLVGNNGTGKSTLFQIITGTISPDGGIVEHANDLKIGFLPQSPSPSDDPVVKYCTQQFFGKEAEWFEQMCLQGTSSIELQRHQQWAEATAENITSHWKELGIDMTRPFSSLSGGEQKKALLAVMMAEQWDLILLDEPTNHLDLDTILWLEKQLQIANTACITITHDRKFADMIATGYLDLADKKIFSSTGKYQECMEYRSVREEQAQRAQNQLAKKIEREEDWMRYGVTARRKRNQRRVEQLHTLREQFKSNREIKRSDLKASHGIKSGSKIICTEKVDVGYSGQPPLIRNLNLIIPKGAKVAICGPNGSGKTTLVNTLIGKIPPNKGTIEHGASLIISEFTQKLKQIKLHERIIDQVGQGATHIQLGEESISIFRYLDGFRLGGEIANMAPNGISGGMQQRLELALALRKPSNLLIVDEPTNNLDMDSLEYLSQYLVAYKGTLLLISHDRQLIEEVATHTLQLDGNGEWQWHHGAHIQRIKDPSPSEKTVTKKKKSLDKSERIELRALPKQIEKLELKKDKLAKNLSDPDLYKSNAAEKLKSLKTEIASIDAQIQEQYQRWEYLEDKSD